MFKTEIYFSFNIYINSIKILFFYLEWLEESGKDIIINLNKAEVEHVLSFTRLFSPANRKRFNSQFDEFLSKKLQDKGIGCWLKNQHNCFLNPSNRKKKTYIWRGKYVCVDKDCSINFSAYMYNKNPHEDISDIKDVSLHVFYNKEPKHLTMINKPVRCTGANRDKQKLVLCSNGLTNTLSENVIFNSSNTENSNLIKFF